MMTMVGASLLALLACVMVAGADFTAGLLTRRHSPFLVLGIATAVAGTAELLFLLTRDEMALTTGTALYGLAAGVLLLVGQGLYFLALSRGDVGVVGGLGTLVVIPPLIAVWATGESLAVAQLAGVAVIAAGIVLLGWTAGSGLAVSRTVLLLVIAGMMLVGSAEVLIDRGSELGPSTTVLFVYAAGPLAFVLARAVAHRPMPEGALTGPSPSMRRAVALMVLTGLMLFGANTSFALATSMGNVALVAALAALDPIAIALLGLVVLRERMTRIQVAGLLLATFGGVLAIVG